jgi:sec-independent protein translocase protein TatB
MLSIPHMIVVFIIVLVVFGPQKLPELARGLGKLMAEFRKASTDFKTAFEEEMRDLDRQAREVDRKKQALLATVAEQVQPATLATPSGVETQVPAPELAPADEESRVTEAGELVAVPVPESVARGVDASEHGPDGAASIASTIGANDDPNLDRNVLSNGTENVPPNIAPTPVTGVDGPAETQLDPTHDRH